DAFGLEPPSVVNDYDCVAAFRPPDRPLDVHFQRSLVWCAKQQGWKAASRTGQVHVGGKFHPVAHRDLQVVQVTNLVDGLRKSHWGLGKSARRLLAILQIMV